MVAKIRTLFVGICFIACSSVVQADEAVSIKLGYLMLSPSGEFAAEVNDFGTRVDLESDLGLDDSENILAEAALSFGDAKLTIGYLPLSFEGNSRLNRTVIFNGKKYTFGSPVESSLNLDIIDIGFTYFFLNLDDTPTRIQLGVELALKITDAEATLKERRFGRTETASETLPIPTIGLRGRIALSDFVGINGRVGYLGYSGNHFLDADVQIEVSPIPMVGIFAGYRYIDLAIDESDIYVDTELSGFYGGAFVRF